MKKRRIAQIMCTLILLMTAAGCSIKSEENKVDLPNTDDTITIVDEDTTDVEEPELTIGNIVNLDNMEISDWLDSETVIVSKENDTLDKMSLAELSDFYPRSLYQYNIKTKEFKLLKAEQDINLGGAKLSPDKKNLIYSGYSLGDATYYVLNLETLESFSLTGEGIGSAGSAKWADNSTVIGTGYTSGAYYADMDGKITMIPEFDQKAIYIIDKIDNTIYYNTAEDNTLMSYNLSTKETKNLGISSVVGVYPSPENNQLLVLQYSGSKQVLVVSELDGSNVKTIAEGVELGGASWSPNQQLVAYYSKSEGANSVGTLMVYDLLTGKATQVAVGVENITTCWSASGNELTFTQWDGNQYNSSIVTLEYSIK
ncbi:MAG: hypothetical protein QM644_10755 [Mobilitalea sp.]